MDGFASALLVGEGGGFDVVFRWGLARGAGVVGSGQGESMCPTIVDGGGASWGWFGLAIVGGGVVAFVTVWRCVLIVGGGTCIGGLGSDIDDVLDVNWEASACID